MSWKRSGRGDWGEGASLLFARRWASVSSELFYQGECWHDLACLTSVLILCQAEMRWTMLVAVSPKTCTERKKLKKPCCDVYSHISHLKCCVNCINVTVGITRSKIFFLVALACFGCVTDSERQCGCRSQNIPRHLFTSIDSQRGLLFFQVMLYSLSAQWLQHSARKQKNEKQKPGIPKP